MSKKEKSALIFLHAKWHGWQHFAAASPALSTHSKEQIYSKENHFPLSPFQEQNKQKMRSAAIPPSLQFKRIPYLLPSPFPAAAYTRREAKKK